MSDQKIAFYFDVVSPYAYLAFQRLPFAIRGVDIAIEYRPILFAGLLNHWGHKGPAEVPPKKAWVFRQVGWLAKQWNIPLATPRFHPFNPLALLRLAWASAPEGSTPSREACAEIFAHVWQSAHEVADDPMRLSQLSDRLCPLHSPADPVIKARLRAETDAAIAQGVFGVPTVLVADKLIWGLDALPMLEGVLQNDPWFDRPDWEDAAHLEGSATRS